MYDREPDKIQSPTKKRDAMVATTDWFGVLFDTFNDKENALAFFTTPAGLRFDAAIFRDAQLTSPTEMPMNLSWNTFWDVAVARAEDGWHVEMRIPLSSLRFQAADGAVVMGVTVFRWISRRNEIDVFPAIPKNWGDMSAWKPSQCQETVWPGLRPRRPLYVTPYVLGGFDRTYELNDEETAYVRGGAPKFELGLDLKYGLTGNLTFDATVNPDFAQVEADDVQVNLTRFSVFFPEKRLFFQERSSNFDFNMGGSNTLFYSRRIGLVGDVDSDDLQAVRIYGGARLVGRLGGWDIGFLDMQTAALEDYSVGELRRPSAAAPGHQPLFLCRGDPDQPPRRRRAATTSPTASTGSGASGRRLPHAAMGPDVRERRRQPGLLPRFVEDRRDVGAADDGGFGTTVRFARVGPDFNPGMGFMMMENYTAFYTRTLYGWFPGKDSALSNHDAFVEARVYWDNATKDLTLAEVGPGWEFTTKSGFSGLIWPKIVRRGPERAVTSSPTTSPSPWADTSIPA